MKTDAHPVGVPHSQGAVVAQLVAVPHLVCCQRDEYIIIKYGQTMP